MEQNETSQTKRRIFTIILPVMGGVALALVIVLIMTVSARQNALVKDTAGNFYRARSLIVAGPIVIYTRDPSGYTTRKAALDSPAEERTLSAVSLKSIAFIEIMSGPDEGGEGLASWQAGLKDYIGDYVVNAAGNHGYLSLRASGSTVYGSIRFPGWGRGATEYLKGVRIAGGTIHFTRSVTTPQELKRVGANAYFTQQYTGEYFHSGSLIRGYYTVQGQRKQWEARKGR